MVMSFALKWLGAIVSFWPSSSVAPDNARVRFAPQSGPQPITGKTTLTLSCIALDGATITKSATVKILPTFQEI